LKPAWRSVKPGHKRRALPGNSSIAGAGRRSEGQLYVPDAGEIPAAARTIPEKIQQAIVARLRNRAIEPQVVVSLISSIPALSAFLGFDVNEPGVRAITASASGDGVIACATVDRVRRRSKAM